ncbi:MAG: PAS domain S-box protein [Leptospiraceae bacterium]|nr:PAS domain S-box protein [Leptospiraceae bacterium]
MNYKKQRTILIVDDDPFTCTATEQIVRSFGYSTVTAFTGAQAIHMFQSNEVDLILMDVELGFDSNGPEFARQILAMREVPILFYSAYNEPDIIKKTEHIASYGYILKGSSITMLGTSIQIALNLFDSSLKMKNEKRYRELISNLDTGILVYSPDTSIILTNSKAEEILGLSEDQLKGKIAFDSHWKFINEDNSPLLVDDYPVNLIRSKMISIKNKVIGVFRQNNRDILWLSITGFPFLDTNGNLEEIIISFIDITERKKSERTLLESEKKFRSYIESALDGVFVTNKEGFYQEVNHAAAQLLGYTRNELLQMHFTETVPEETVENAKSAYTTLLEEGVFTTEVIFQRKDGSRFTGILSSTKISEDQYLGLVKDITERKVAEENVHKLLAEKEIILKEIHHRIKNNMYSVYGLLQLQSQTLKEDNAAAAALEDAAIRIQSMMLLYDKLYQSEQFTDLLIEEYISPLVDEVIENFPNIVPIRVIKEIGDIVLDAKRLSNIGIILNELLTNIMKYAFKGRSEGLIRVSAQMVEDKVVILVQDNGIGIPEGIDFANSTGFGLKLIAMLTKQIEGKGKIERENGTTVHLEFIK